MLINKVIPAIKEKWPSKSRRIYIQMDNARPHPSASNIELTNAMKSDGFDIYFDNQPPNSPDLNFLDLGCFTSIQSLQQSMCCKTVNDFIVNAQSSFANLDHFLGLFICYELLIRWVDFD